jgi:hypothetical protein
VGTRLHGEGRFRIRFGAGSIGFEADTDRRRLSAGPADDRPEPGAEGHMSRKPRTALVTGAGTGLDARNFNITSGQIDVSKAASERG